MSAVGGAGAGTRALRLFSICADPGISPDGTKGASVHLRSLAGALRRQGHDLTLFVTRPPADPDLVPARVLPLGTLRETSASEGPPDAVYERYALGHVGGLEFAREVGAPFALEVNAPLVWEAGRHRPDTVRPAHEAVEDRLFTESDVVLAVSEPLRRYVAGVRGSPDGTAVLRNGCDPELFPVPAYEAPPPPAPTLVFLGHPKPWHGAELLAPILVELGRMDVPARLLIVGGGPGADAVVDAARNAGVGDRVETTGPLPAPAAARRLLDATVAVAPYPPDPFFYFCPLKVVECMAAGLPVVSSDQGDLRQLVGEAGLLVPPGDVRALALAVHRVLQDDRLRRRLGEEGRRRALSRFTWDRVAGELAATLSAAAGARAR